MTTTPTKKISKLDLLKKLTKPAKEIPPPPVAPPQKEVINHGDVVNYYVEYADGTVHLAQGKHAHLVYRFTMEAQKLATMHAFAYYEGPGMEAMSKEEAIKRMSGEKNAK